jgi:hypothetical protein
MALASPANASLQAANQIVHLQGHAQQLSTATQGIVKPSDMKAGRDKRALLELAMAVRAMMLAVYDFTIFSNTGAVNDPRTVNDRGNRGAYIIRVVTQKTWLPQD